MGPLPVLQQQVAASVVAVQLHTVEHFSTASSVSSGLHVHLKALASIANVPVSIDVKSHRKIHSITRSAAGNYTCATGFRGQNTLAAAPGAGRLFCNTCRFAETPQLRDSRANTEAMRTLGTMICYSVFPTRAEHLDGKPSQRQAGAKGDAESACYGTSSRAN